MGQKGPSCAGKAGCPLAWEQGQGVGIGHFAGRLSCFLAEGERAETKQRTHKSLGGSHSPVVPSAVRGPYRFLLAIPYRVNLYL